MKDSNKFLSLLAFLAIMISAIAYIVLVILGYVLDETPKIFPLISGVVASLNLIVLVGIGWQYAKGLNSFWKIFFLVVAILAIISAFFPALLSK